MIRALFLSLTLLATTMSASSNQSHPYRLSFEARVRAREAIERVYYSHRIGAVQPFEQAVPRGILERKVDDSLRETEALRRFWNVRITSADLERELQRIASRTRFPDRLREIYAALGNDVFLIQETFVRASLVDRLARQRFATDRDIHAAARREAETIHSRLVDGELDPRDDDPRRTTFDEAPGGEARARGPASAAVGTTGPVVEEADRFIVDVMIEVRPGRLRLARYTVPKVSWKAWWQRARGSLGSHPDIDVADASVVLPEPVVGVALTCSADEYWDDGSSNGQVKQRPTGRSYHTAVWTGSLMIVWGGAAGPYATRVNTGGRYDPVLDLWTPTSLVDAPAPRSDHTAVWTGSKMVIWGGRDDVSALGTGGTYDPVSDTWSPISMAGAPEPRYHHTAAWTGSRMVIWGGLGLTALNTGARYDPVADAWTPTSLVNAPSARSDHEAVWTGDRMLVWGGTNNDTTGGSYDPATDSWTATSTLGAPSPRRFHTTVWDGSEMIVWGGADPSYVPLGTGARYRPDTDTWTPTSATNAPPPRRSHAAVWTGSEMVVYGGGNYADDGAILDRKGGRYDPATDSWTPTSTTDAPLTGLNATGIWTGRRLVVWGGDGGYGLAGYFLATDAGGRYDPVTDAWTATSLPALVPAMRARHSTVWTGDLMIIWGGYGGAYEDTGGRYDPLIDTWTPTSLIDAPQARVDPTAVWTGSRMIVWGGSVNATPLNNGGSYDPLADVWSPIATTGAPPGGGDYAAVWTGTRMLVWGGYGSAQPGSGALYDPVTDSWAPMSGANAPDPRLSFTMVWTGSRMVVWGGYDGTSEFDTGGRYDPASDAWAPMSTTGAPAGRDSHSAVWTGQEMIVWGGYDDINNSGEVDTGGRYDPVADTWASTSTTGVAEARFVHSALWTGRDMLVWGGVGASGILDTGARYDPASDSWTPMTTTGAPVGRYYHSAVWTGRVMIVWGGYARTIGYTNTGGRYAFDQLADDDMDGFAVCDGDCDDADGAVYPGAPQICDGKNNDCDSASWPSLVGTDEADGDADGFSTCQGDCNDTDGTVWATPGEVQSLVLTGGLATTLAFAPPASPGGSADLYDVIASPLANDFAGSGFCVAWDGSMTTAEDATVPPVGGVIYYLARAENSCPATMGDGSLGTDSHGIPRTGLACP